MESQKEKSPIHELYPKVFIATPTHICKRYCADKFLQGIFSAFHVDSYLTKNITGPQRNFSPVIAIADNGRSSAANYYNAVTLRNNAAIRYFYFHLSLPEDFYHQADSIHRRIVYSMNFLRDKFLETDCKYFLSLESDVIFNKAALDFMLEDIQKYHVVHSNCYPGFHTEQELCEVDRLTLGCTMIKRSVIEQIDFRYDRNLLAAFHDALFAHDCKQKNIKMIYNPKIQVNHVCNSSGSRGWEQLPVSEK